MDLERKRLLIGAGEATAGVAASIAALAEGLGAETALAGRGIARAPAGSAATRWPARATLELDASQEGDRRALVGALSERWDGLEGVVHVTGVPSGMPDEDDFATAMAVAERAFVANAHSLSALARATLPLLQASGPGGSIVGVSVADASANGAPGGITGAFEAVNRYAACELGPRGIRVNVVVTGVGVADPTPVARVACFLLSDWARAVTGEVLHVDEGAAVP